MRKNQYYKWINKKVIVCNDFDDWAKWFQNADRTVKKTKITKKIEVSTVFLSIDHAFFQDKPVLFETLVFGGKFDGYLIRYHTYEQSLQGHEDIVKLCKSEFIHLTENKQLN